MYRIIVRSKKDSDAIKAMIEKFYPDWNIEVATLHGARSIERVLNELEQVLSHDKLNIILLGREDQELAKELHRYLPPNAVVHVVPRTKVRNTRIEMLAHEFDIARSIFRLSIRWCPDEETYSLNPHSTCLDLEDYKVEPAHDLFILYDKGLQMLNELLGVDLDDEYAVVLRMLGGEHRVYRGHDIIAKLKIPDEGIDIYSTVFRSKIHEGFKLRLANLLKANLDIIKVYENISLTLIRYFASQVDIVIVPWSGGKDSTATLLLTLQVVERSKIRAIYVDTGLEFPQTRDYVCSMAKKLGIEVVERYAGIDKELRTGSYKLPTHENRWCTALKIAATEAFVRELAENSRVMVVVGDRDAESERRALRPPIRIENNIVYVAPIKFWGTLHVQLYLLYRDIPMNPLYNLGFYRIGCYICPALRSWELRALHKDTALLRRLAQDSIFIEFLKSKGIDPSAYFS